MSKNHTTIRITTELREVLMGLGNKGQSYDEIIREQLRYNEMLQEGKYDKIK